MELHAAYTRVSLTRCFEKTARFGRKGVVTQDYSSFPTPFSLLSSAPLVCVHVYMRIIGQFSLYKMYSLLYDTTGQTEISEL